MNHLELKVYKILCKSFNEVEYIEIIPDFHQIKCYVYPNLFGERSIFYTGGVEYWLNKEIL